jgi:D-sedoheptulose 7-phosphate isomerase
MTASIAAMQGLLAMADDCARIAEVLVTSYRAGGAMILFGNGGSAADAQHIAAELLGRFTLDRAGLPAHALNVNTSALTAIANDFDFDAVFARQVAAIGRPGDVAVGLSTSGNSRNVIAAVRAAKERGMVTVGLTGAGGGQLMQEADHCLCVPSSDTPRIQECHILVGHIWCEIIERALSGDTDADDRLS